VSDAVEIRDLFRVYSTPEGDAAALQGLSLVVQEREIVTVLGPSGSGKTTLLRLLAGFERPSAGSVRVLGLDVGRLASSRLAAYRAQTIGYIEQHYTRALASELTARELVAVELGLRGAPRRARRAGADELLERIGLSDRGDAPPYELSGGEQQRIAVCAALAHRPRLLLADEPTGELDARSAALVYGLVGELAREHGCTALVVSHDPASASIADRTLSIRDGRVSSESVVAAGSARQIVVGRGGWLRLPEEYLRHTGIDSRATARVEEGSIVVSPAGTDAEEAPAKRSQTPGPARLPRQGPRPPAEEVAEIRELTKTYGATPVLAGLSGAFLGGKLHAVTGPSGSGKTTLLHLLAGLELPTSGRVSILGMPLSDLGRRARAALRADHVALVGQHTRLVHFLSARENVELGLALRRRGDAERAAREALDAVGLGERAEQRVSRLSMGERARVAIARALAARPALLLADEPTARLDEANALAVGVLLGRLAHESGAAVVCATHDPLLIEQADEELSLAAGARPEATVAAGAESAER
jgi:ABC-type lipoprotein export system ATPase subunit